MLGVLIAILVIVTIAAVLALMILLLILGGITSTARDIEKIRKQGEAQNTLMYFDQEDNQHARVLH